MSKFTAGPWRAEGLDIMGEWEDGESITIANCGATRFCGDEAGGPKDKRMKAENVGNAALISAAPEIYEALKMAEGYIYGVATNEPEEQDKLMGIIKSALKKAEGAL